MQIHIIQILKAVDYIFIFHFGEEIYLQKYIKSWQILCFNL